MSDNPRVEAVLQSSVQARVSNLDCDIGVLCAQATDREASLRELHEAIARGTCERDALRAWLAAHEVTS